MSRITGGKRCSASYLIHRHLDIYIYMEADIPNPFGAVSAASQSHDHFSYLSCLAKKRGGKVMQGSRASSMPVPNIERNHRKESENGADGWLCCIWQRKCCLTSLAQWALCIRNLGTHGDPNAQGCFILQPPTWPHPQAAPPSDSRRKPDSLTSLPRQHQGSDEEAATAPAPL